MNVFLDASAFLKVLKKEEGYAKVVQRLNRIRDSQDQGHTDSIVIGEIVYAFLSRGLDDEAVRARAYVADIPNLTVVEAITSPICHRAAELKKKYFRRSEKTFFSLYDGVHLALAERWCDVFLTSDSDFEKVTELPIEFV